jgi:hypothetical protein
MKYRSWISGIAMCLLASACTQPRILKYQAGTLEERPSSASSLSVKVSTQVLGRPPQAESTPAAVLSDQAQGRIVDAHLQSSGGDPEAAIQLLIMSRMEPVLNNVVFEKKDCYFDRG